MLPISRLLSFGIALFLGMPTAHACVNEAPKDIPARLRTDVNLHGQQVAIPYATPKTKTLTGFDLIYYTAAANDMDQSSGDGLLSEFLDVYSGKTDPIVKQIEVDDRTHQAAENPTWANRNDLTVSLMRNGQAKDAVRQLVQLEHDFPGHYETAANLGTAYELSGDDKKALIWITEGIKRNPKSHAGTEWLHVKILEAKIAEKAHPGWLTTHSVSGADFGTKPLPSLHPVLPPNSLGRPMSVKEFQRAIEYQVAERVQFVDAPNAIVGDLLLDFASAAAIRQGPKVAITTLRIARQYGTPRMALLDAREKALRAYGVIHPPTAITLQEILLAVLLSVMVCLSWVHTAYRLQRVPATLLSTWHPLLWGALGLSSSLLCLGWAVAVPLSLSWPVSRTIQSIIVSFSVLYLLLHMWGRAATQQMWWWLSPLPFGVTIIVMMWDPSPWFTSRYMVFMVFGVFMSWAYRTVYKSDSFLGTRRHLLRAEAEAAAYAHSD